MGFVVPRDTLEIAAVCRICYNGSLSGLANSSQVIRGYIIFLTAEFSSASSNLYVVEFRLTRYLRRYHKNMMALLSTGSLDNTVAFYQTLVLLPPCFLPVCARSSR